jgi:hypothetical protein
MILSRLRESLDNLDEFSKNAAQWTTIELRCKISHAETKTAKASHCE